MFQRNRLVGVVAIAGSGLLAAALPAAASAPPDSSPVDSAAGGSIPVAEFDQALFDLLPESAQGSETH